MTSTATEPRANGLFKLAPTAPILGEIITWNAAGITVRHRHLVEALRDRGLDETVARELAPRHAFARACKKLAEHRIIRQVDEDEAVLRFQFTAERKAGDRFEYDLETMLSLEKATGRVSCDLPGLATLAQEALDECLGLRTGGDITRVIQRLFERQADLFPIREQGGCYFVPAEHLGFVDRIAQLVAQLNGKMRRFPIPAGTAHGDRSVKESVAAGLEAMIREHEAAIAEFGHDTRAATFERAAERIRLTRHKIEAYATYLAEEKGRLEAVIAAASARLRARVEELSSGREAPGTRPSTPTLLR
jgi:hypothetical protein